MRETSLVDIGQFNSLTVIETLDHSVRLDAGDGGSVLLAGRAAPADCQPGDVLDVFVYVDAHDRLAATTEAPLACVGEFAWLKVVAVNEVGAFLDWGLPKDLLLPYGEQKYPPEVGKRVMVKVLLHERTQRIIASTRIDSFVEEEAENLKNGQPVSILISDKTELGFKAIVDNRFWGVLYANEVYQPLTKGQRLTAYIKQIRPDQKIDLTLAEPGYATIPSLAEQIISRLREHDGFLMLTDKSSPETIRAVFKVSKKAYKKAVGALYKQRRIVIEDKGIRLIE